MKYFILKQDRNLENSIELRDFNTSEKMMFLKKDEEQLKDMINIHVKGNEDSVYPEFFQSPVLIVSDDLHKIFTWYENTIIYKTVVLTSLEMKTQKVYRMVLPELVEGLSSRTTYLKNGDIGNIVLDSEKIKDYNIFLVKAGLDYQFIASLDVVESILKRRFIGINFEEVEVI